jgi:hypothetical protein
MFGYLSWIASDNLIVEGKASAGATKKAELRRLLHLTWKAIRKVGNPKMNHSAASASSIVFVTRSAAEASSSERGRGSSARTKLAAKSGVELILIVCGVPNHNADR